MIVLTYQVFRSCFIRYSDHVLSGIRIMFYQIFTDVNRFFRANTRSTLGYVFEVYVEISLGDLVQCL